MNWFTILIRKGSDTERRRIKAHKFYLTNDSAIVFEDAGGEDLIAFNKDCWIVCSKDDDE